MPQYIRSIFEFALPLIVLVLIYKRNMFLPHIYDVAQDDKGLYFIVLGRVSTFISYDEIESVEKTKSPFMHSFGCRNFVNRFMSDKFLIVRKKRGLIYKKVIVTPVDGKKFVEMCAERNVSVL